MLSWAWWRSCDGKRGGKRLASFPGIEAIAVGTTFIGLILAGVGFFVAFRQDTGTLYPILGILVCLPALAWSTYCYTQVPKPDKGRTAADLAKSYVVPTGQRNLALSEDKAVAAHEGEPVDIARQAMRQGDLQVTVTRVSIAKATFADPPPGKKPPAEKFLIVELRLTNVGVERKYDYSGWGQWGGENAASLRDTKGKVYKIKRFDAAWEIKGQVRSTSILPGKSVDDIIVFEAPPPKEIPSRLRLELPAAAFGGKDKFLFEIGSKNINITP